MTVRFAWARVPAAAAAAPLLTTLIQNVPVRLSRVTCFEARAITSTAIPPAGSRATSGQRALSCPIYPDKCTNIRPVFGVYVATMTKTPNASN